MPRASVLTAAAVTCNINGQNYGRVTSFSWSASTPHRAIRGIDSLEAQELAPASVTVTGTMSLYRIVGDGGLEGTGVAANIVDIPREKYFTIQLIDRGSDLVIFEAQQCLVQSQSWNVPSRGTVTGSVTFEALNWNNESRSLGPGN
jgi:hypothetical protein